MRSIQATNGAFTTLVICCKFQKNLRGQGQITPMSKFWAPQEAIITLINCWKFQNDWFELWFYIDFFMILCMYMYSTRAIPTQGQILNYIAYWAGKDNLMGSVQVTTEAFTTLVVCCYFQKNSLNSDFIWICLWFYSGGAGADNSNGVIFEHHRKLLSLWSSDVSFRRNIGVGRGGGGQWGPAPPPPPPIIWEGVGVQRTLGPPIILPPFPSNSMWNREKSQMYQVEG